MESGESLRLKIEQGFCACDRTVENADARHMARAAKSCLTFGQIVFMRPFLALDQARGLLISYLQYSPPKNPAGSIQPGTVKERHVTYRRAERAWCVNSNEIAASTGRSMTGVEKNGWTEETVDASIAAQSERMVAFAENGPKIPALS